MDSLKAQPSRRKFLTAAAGFAVAAGVAPLSAALKQEPIRVAVIGGGGRGSELIRKLTTIEAARIVAVCDDYEPHLRKGAEYAGAQAKSFSDYREMLEKTKPQAVLVAVPLWLHFKVCSDVLANGCDLFCE